MGVWDEIKKEGLHALYILAIIIVLMLFSLLLRACS